MIRTLRKSLLASALASLTFPAFAGEMAALQDFRDVDLPSIAISGRGPFALIDEFLSHVDTDADAEDVDVEVEAAETDDGFVVDIRLRGYKDDSLLGEDFRLVLDKTDGRYFIARAGVQYVCARGANAGKAQPNYCP